MPGGDQQIPLRGRRLSALKAERGVSHIKVLVLGVFTSPETLALLRTMGGLCREMPSDGPGWLALAAELIAVCNKPQRPRVAPLQSFRRPLREPCTPEGRGRSSSHPMAVAVSRGKERIPEGQRRELAEDRVCLPGCFFEGASGAVQHQAASA